MTITGLVAQGGLSAEDLIGVRHLAGLCKLHDGIDVKFNYSMLDMRDPADATDFLWFENGELVGYLPLDQFGNKAEITAAVHPEHRGKGIFRSLYAAALGSPAAAKCTEILMVNYRSSKSGSALVALLKLPLDSSEYSMSVESSALPTMPESGGLVLRIATSADVPVLAAMIQTNFGAGGWGTEKDLAEELARAGRYYFIAEVEGQIVGHIGTLREQGGVYIRGVGILPQWRGKGWGRRMLAESVRHELVVAGVEPVLFSLDVATQNENALSIYQSCGFEASIVYDYYRVV